MLARQASNVRVPPMTDIILHHYDTSPYAEKVRTGLGLKGLAWASVELPVIMPKPNLTALTGPCRWPRRSRRLSSGLVLATEFRIGGGAARRLSEAPDMG